LDTATFVSGKALAAGQWRVKTGGFSFGAHIFAITLSTKF